jgi:hypothetical protein
MSDEGGVGRLEEGMDRKKEREGKQNTADMGGGARERERDRRG